MRHVLSAEDKHENGKFTNTYIWQSTFADFKEKHDIGDLAVQDWSNAYSCSGLFQITKGSRKHPKDPNGLPTLWKYSQAATRRDWTAFILGLSAALNPPDGKRMARHGWSAGIDASHAYKLVVALEVDKARANKVGTPPLPPINEHKIDVFLERGYGTRLEDGSIEWEYAPSKGLSLREQRYGS